LQVGIGRRIENAFLLVSWSFDNSFLPRFSDAESYQAMEPKRIDLGLVRVLQFRIRGEVTEGLLQISRLEFLPERRQWACYWSLAFVHPEEAKIYGSDAMEALSQGLDFISNLVRGSERDGLQVWWKTEGDHGGLGFTEYPYRSLR
jgi:hypothetical protein